MGDYVRTENNGMVMDREAAVRQTEGLNACRFLWRMLLMCHVSFIPFELPLVTGREHSSGTSSRHGDVKCCSKK